MAEKINKEINFPKKVFNLGKIRDMIKSYKINNQLKIRTSELTANDISTIQWTSGTEKEPKACPMSP
ncbi:MAG: hypothetical protein ACYDAO_04800 [Thermoplasmataceae archaeon]